MEFSRVDRRVVVICPIVFSMMNFNEVSTKQTVFMLDALMR